MATSPPHKKLKLIISLHGFPFKLQFGADAAHIMIAKAAFSLQLLVALEIVFCQQFSIGKWSFRAVASVRQEGQIPPPPLNFGPEFN